MIGSEKVFLSEAENFKKLQNASGESGQLTKSIRNDIKDELRIYLTE